MYLPTFWFIEEVLAEKAPIMEDNRALTGAIVYFRLVVGKMLLRKLHSSISRDQRWQNG
jgi:hypothetical protein